MNGIGFSRGKEFLQDFQCSECNLFLTEEEISKENYSFWFSDYANDITKEVSLSGKGYVYGADFWLKGVDHQECPDTEKCDECCQTFLADQLKEFKEAFYCPSCYPKEEVNNA